MPASAACATVAAAEACAGVGSGHAETAVAAVPAEKAAALPPPGSFHLEVGEWLQGREPSVQGAVSVILVFQVNCPGCFLSALPLFLSLYQEYSSGQPGSHVEKPDSKSNRVQFVLVSTAFGESYAFCMSSE
jgi:hypothetical protein